MGRGRIQPMPTMAGSHTAKHTHTHTHTHTHHKQSRQFALQIPPHVRRAVCVRVMHACGLDPMLFLLPPLPSTARSPDGPTSPRLPIPIGSSLLSKRAPSIASTQSCPAMAHARVSPSHLPKDAHTGGSLSVGEQCARRPQHQNAFLTACSMKARMHHTARCMPPPALISPHDGFNRPCVAHMLAARGHRYPGSADGGARDGIADGLTIWREWCPLNRAAEAAAKPLLLGHLYRYQSEVKRGIKKRM